MRVMSIAVQIPASLRGNLQSVVRLGYWGGSEREVASRFVLERLMQLTGEAQREISGFMRRDLGDDTDD